MNTIDYNAPQFEFSPLVNSKEGIIYCNRPLLLNVAVGLKPMATADNILYHDERGFYFSYKPHADSSKQQSVIKRMADWYYYTVLNPPIITVKPNEKYKVTDRGDTKRLQ